jgi:hypothetical protein
VEECHYLRILRDVLDPITDDLRYQLGALSVSIRRSEE